jgi:hypothetical protein
LGLRIPEKYQKYRYAKISQHFEAGQFYRYVGEIATFGRPVLLPKNGRNQKDGSLVISLKYLKKCGRKILGFYR